MTITPDPPERNVPDDGTTLPRVPPQPEQPEPGVIVNVPGDNADVDVEVDEDTKRAQREAEQAPRHEREDKPREAEDSQESDEGKV